MRRFLCAICVLGLWAVALAAGSDDADFSVMSFNIRYDNGGDGDHNWELRRDRVADAIRFYQPDILGTQEVLANQLDDLRERLEAYDVVGVGREDGARQGEAAALWWRRDRWELLDSGNFWLSETPEVAGSMGWDGACVRIASWALLRDRSTGRELLALNTHLDHVGEMARREGVSLILNRVEQLSGGRPVVVTGDFNSTPDSDVVGHVTDRALAYHLDDSRSLSTLVYGPAWSFHDFGRLPVERRVLIDYVFTHGLHPARYGVLAETHNGQWLSDHCPVLVYVNY